MSKLIFGLIFLVTFVAAANSLKCYKYKCGYRNGIISCSANYERVTCGIPGKGYQSVCSYVARDEIKHGGFEVEAACDLVPIGCLQSAKLKRCVDPEIEGRVVFCNLCNTDLCNTRPRP
ncbi:hypothetical protein FQR65_LT01815 [Abscondita terminalis]|nr:hypothetical protein FQR65_LT01815 [Abscondita terminalis]